MGRRYITSTMHALRKWVNKPRKNDTRLLAQFYHADEELIRVTQELDSFDGRTEPERCSQLIAELKMAQEKVIGLVEEIKNVIAPGCDEFSREFRVKFPDEVLQDNLAGQLWFGAECLCAGSTIVNREQESIQLRPLARQVVKSLGRLRSALREQALKNLNVFPSVIKESIIGFDEVFARFEFEYVSILSRVRSVDDHDKLLDISVLFCETVDRAIEKQLLDQELIEDYDPGLMITIPRLAIICGVLVFPDGPLDLSKGPEALPHMFKPFYKLLRKIRDLLLTLSDDELFILEKTLCSEENFDEVVLAADTLLTGSNFNQTKSYPKSKEKSRSRRYGSMFSDYLIPAMREAEKERLNGSIDETTTAIPEHTTVLNALDDSSRRVPPTLTIITEVEVHNSFSEAHHSNSSSSTTTPNSTIQNSDRGGNQRFDCSLHIPTSHTPEPSAISGGGGANSNSTNQSSDVPHLADGSQQQQHYLPRNSAEVNNTQTIRAPYPYVSRLPDDPPPPYSPGPEEDGYSSSGESDSNENLAKRSETEPVMESACASLSNDYSSSWPRPHRSNPRRETWLICNNPSNDSENAEDLCSSSESASCSIEGKLDVKSGGVLEENQSHVSPDIHRVQFSDEVQSQQWDFTYPSDEHRAVSSKSDQNLCPESSEHAASVMQSQEESGSSTSTLFIYKDSSSDTESEGLIPQKFHLLRSKFKSTRDLIHTLFVCISGVADQLQSNYASDLRQTLKSVFLTVSSGAERSSDEIKNDITKGWLTSKQYFSLKQHEEPPPWIDDSECNCCARCSACFSFFKRRHHCRLCGKIFCSTCASNFVPLPRYGLVSPVRVCTECIETALDRLV